MKKILLLTLGLGLSGALLTGCKDFLELESTNSQPDVEFLKNVGNVESVLVGSYGQAFGDNFLGGEVLRTSEEYSDNLDLGRVTAGGGAGAQFTSRDFSLFNSQGRDLWSRGYTAISRANTVIAAIDENTFAADQNVKDRLRAEAQFVRAVAHFELVRLFAKPYTSNAGGEPGVPIRIVAVTTQQAADRVPRSSVGAVYDQVIADLRAAEAVLPAINGNRATKWAAKAYLARVYFNKEDYANAFAYSDDVIKNGGFNLGSPANKTAVTLPFRVLGGDVSPNGTPVIFQAVGTTSNDVSNIARNNFFNSNNESVGLPLGTSLSDALRNRGGRRDSLLVSRPASTLPFSLKYQGGVPINIPVIRLAEMHLTRAESAVQKGGFDATTVREDYNILRRLASLSQDASSSTADALLNNIREERRVELFTENDRFHELRRLRQNIRGLAYNDAKMLLKIPDIETQANPDIEQN